MKIFESIMETLATFIVFIYIIALYIIALVTFPVWVVPYAIWKKNSSK